MIAEFSEVTDSVDPRSLVTRQLKVNGPEKLHEGRKPTGVAKVWQGIEVQLSKSHKG